MSQIPEISIIIPAYNAGETIRSSIDSVFEQSHEDYELIIVDDASDKDLASALKGIQDPRLTILKHRKNQGAAGARNTAIQAAKGHYVAFLDADDVWYPHKLETQLEFMRESDENIRASCSSFAMRRLNGRTHDRILSATKNWNKMLLGGCTVSPGTTLIAERSLFDNNEIGLFSIALRRLEDWDWLLSYIKSNKLGIIEEVLAEVRVSGYPDYQIAKEAADKLLQVKEPFIRENFGKSSVNIFKAGLEIENAGTAFRNKKYITSLKHLARATLTSPTRILQLMKRIAEKLKNADYSADFKLSK